MKVYIYLFYFSFLSITAFAQSEWYKNTPVKNDDPYGFETAYHINFKGLKLDGNFATGKYYANLKRYDFDRIWNNLGHQEILDSLLITNSNKKSFAKHFDDKGSAKIPFVLQIVGEMVSYIGYTTKILEVASLADDDHKSKATQLSGLIAIAGKFERILVLSKKEEGKYYANLLTTYKVKVGSENRRYIISKKVIACLIE